MLVRNFKFKRNHDRAFRWTAQSEIERPGFYRGFTAVGKTLFDVKEFAALVRWCETNRETGTVVGDAHTRFREANADDLGRELVSEPEKGEMSV